MRGNCCKSARWPRFYDEFYQNLSVPGCISQSLIVTMAIFLGIPDFLPFAVKTWITAGEARSQMRDTEIREVARGVLFRFSNMQHHIQTVEHA
ncbi:hypothetical protein BJX99DRAFT_226793 [Aspergillus californicus]